jgi:hypothetical protein
MMIDDDTLQLVNGNRDGIFISPNSACTPFKRTF